MNMRLQPGSLPEPFSDDAAAEPAVAHIPRLTGELPYRFADLREKGIALTQALSGEHWTDYNHHDPGVTLLEALCFALTEGVFGAEMSVADLLTAADGRIHYRRHGLHAAEEVLPCRPTTELDQLRWILDRVPAIRHLRMQMRGAAAARADGVWQMALRAPAGVGDAAAAAAACAYWAQRNLGEDLDGLPRVLQPRWCSLKLALSVEGPRELTDILTELVQRCAGLISAAPPRQPLQTRLAQCDASGRPLAPSELFDGPSVQHGWIATEDLTRDPANRLFCSDLARALADIDGIVEIRQLSLVADGLAVSDGSLPWHGPGWALQLRWPDTLDALADWEVTRRGSQLVIDGPALLRRLADELQAGRIAPAIANTRRAAPRLLARPAGQHLPAQAYFAAFNHLPPLYRGAEADWRSGPAQAGDPVEQAQFTAYLALLEQWLAHGDAQMQHLRQLYTVEAEPAQSYWWETLGSKHLAGLDELYVDGPAGMARCAAAFTGTDEVLARRSRVLDQLLALHGERCTQGSIQGFGWYYSPEAWQRQLFECKRQLLVRVVSHTRDRYGAIDYSRPSLGRKGNTAPLQERIGLLLGFSQWHSRPLVQGLPRWGVQLADEPGQGGVLQGPAKGQALAMWSPLRARIVSQLDADLLQQRLVARLGHYFTGLDWQALPPALLRCAVHADRYQQVADDPLHPLWLGPDEAGNWWPLAVRPGPGSPVAPALYLHEFACRLQRDSEGLHLVEHILLRPLAGSASASAAAPDSAAAPLPASFYPHQLTLVFPAWTARGADQTFRDLAEETVALGCPAHIQAHVLWLDVPALRHFEGCYRDWLQARQAYCAWQLQPDAASEATLVQGLNDRAEVLARLLWTASRPVPTGEPA